MREPMEGAGRFNLTEGRSHTIGSRTEIAEEIAVLLEREAHTWDREHPTYPAAGVLFEAAALVREWGTIPAGPRQASD